MILVLHQNLFVNVKCFELREMMNNKLTHVQCLQDPKVDKHLLLTKDKSVFSQ